ncbi:MAG TPA: glutamate--tRNA ligase [Candidatus Methylomirabilis sp.]|nr:glutamate--tRNA ligase [Candidatus Methylomirabilis sp.]
MNKIRLRFAPSPTGFLHIGGLRTALFDYLIAKSLGGILFLRIEDTDTKREVAGAVDKLIEILDWAGIKFDEGPGLIRATTNPDQPNEHKDIGDYGPYIQSQRQEIYKKYTLELVSKDEAYPCFCSEERLAQMRADQEARKMPPRYDRACRDLSREEVEHRIAAGEKYVVRHKLPLTGEITVKDELRGELKFKLEDLDDYVLIKSDGIPTYQFASVVDDHLMETSHVVRGEEWLPSLPKNILLYQSFGWAAPLFIHLPLVLDKAGGKLSKRKGNVSVEDFRAAGYLPEALLNFNALLGWSPYAKASADAASGQSNSEIFTIDEAIKVFDYHNIGTSPAIFNTEKLDYLNGIYIRNKSIGELIELCRPYLAENIQLTSNDYKKSEEFLGKVIGLERERLKKLSEIGEYTKFFFVDNLAYDKKMLVWKKSTPEATKVNLENLLDFLGKISDNDWQTKKLEELTVAYLKNNNFGIGDYLWPLRVALTGEQASPSPFEMADALGKEETLAKIKKAISFFQP